MSPFPYLPVVAIMATVVTDNVLQMSVVPYAGFMVANLGVVDDKDKAGKTYDGRRNVGVVYPVGGLPVDYCSWDSGRRFSHTFGFAYVNPRAREPVICRITRKSAHPGDTILNFHNHYHQVWCCGGVCYLTRPR